MEKSTFVTCFGGIASSPRFLGSEICFSKQFHLHTYKCVWFQCNSIGRAAPSFEVSEALDLIFKMKMEAESIIKGQYIGRLVGWFLRRCIFNVISVGPVPAHIAFIMDGNRRYAKKRNLPQVEGYKAGFSSLVAMLSYCYELGVKYVTVYAFSIDNFKRDPDEVQSLMDLLVEKIEELLNQESVVHQYGIRLHFVGNLRLLTDKVRAMAQKAMKATAGNDKAVLVICIAYTSTDEMVHAVDKSRRENLKSFKTKIVSERHHVIRLSDVEKNMYMAVAPEPDIVVRSSGETRLSNFLTWQTSYSLFYSPAALWPEIGPRHLVWGVLCYQRSFAYLEKQKKQP